MTERTLQEAIQQMKESYPIDRKIINEAFGVNCTTGIEMEEVNVRGMVKAFTGDIVRVHAPHLDGHGELGIVVYNAVECPMIVSHEWRIDYLELLKGIKSEKNGGLNLTSFEIVTHFNEHSHFNPDILTHSKFPPFRFV